MGWRLILVRVLSGHGQLGTSTRHWKSRSVLVTGATGFIGSWLAETLVQKGACVTALVAHSDPFGVDALKHLSGVRIVYGDLRQERSLVKAVRNQEVIFHLAAITQVLYSMQNPVETFEVNANGTLNLLETTRKENDQAILIFASTDKVYGEPQYLPLDETHPLMGKSPYDASKIAAERLVHAYHVSYGLQTSIARWSNTYGGRDAHKLRAVPDFVTTILDGRTPTIRGDGKDVRDYMHVIDSVRALLLLAANVHISNGEVFNFGTHKPTSVMNLARQIVKLSNTRQMPVALGTSAKGEIRRQYLSYSKAKSLLGWEPQVDLKKGLRRTIQWYSANPWWRTVMDRVARFYRYKQLVGAGRRNSLDT